MTTVRDIYNCLDEFAPFRTQMSFDNSGLLAGSPDAEVRTVLLALDITPDVVREAASGGAQLIVSHHPVIFNPLRALTPGTAPYLLVQNGIAAVCAHTNLDLAPGGVNTCLAERLGLLDVGTLETDKATGLPCALAGRTARALEPREFAASVKKALGCDGLFYTDGRRNITRAGLCSGAGADSLRAAAESGCEAFVTGEAKHHEMIDAENLGVTLVVAGHYFTENVVIGPLAGRLGERFPEVAFVRSEASHCPVMAL